MVLSFLKSNTINLNKFISHWHFNKKFLTECQKVYTPRCQKGTVPKGDKFEFSGKIGLGGVPKGDTKNPFYEKKGFNTFCSQIFVVMRFTVFIFIFCHLAYQYIFYKPSGSISKSCWPFIVQFKLICLFLIGFSEKKSNKF